MIMNYFTCPICFHAFPRNSDEIGLRQFTGKKCHECGHRATEEEISRASRCVARKILARSIDRY
jgi:predicted Zn-ribbon and HTH transcriptional regulator